MIKRIFLLLVVFGLAVSAAEPSANPSPNRFLFVVETSFAMNRSAKAAKEVVRELIQSGVQGQMRPGDSFSLWTFNEKLNVEYPLQYWAPAEHKKLAANAEAFLNKRRFEKKAQLQTMLPSLYSVIKSSKAITVILISTGSQMIQGTPFDQEINGVYPVHARELRNSKIPFVTILVGRYGRPVAYTVNSSLSILIPNPPVVTPPAKTNATGITNKSSATKTNLVAPVKQIAKENVVVTKPPTTNNPLITAMIVVQKTNPPSITNPANVPPTNIEPSVSIAGKTNVSIAPAAAVATVRESVSSNAPSLILTPVPTVPAIQSSKDERILSVEVSKSSAQKSTQPPFIAKNSEPHKSETQNVAVATSEQTPKSPTETLLTSNNHGALSASTVNKTSGTSSNSASVPVAVAQPEVAPKRLLMLAVGLILVAAVVILFIAQISRNKSQPSLISRSMDPHSK